MTDWGVVVRNSFDRQAVHFTAHARREMEFEEFGVILVAELIEAVQTMEVLREYPDDLPMPSALIYGSTYSDRPLHFVVAFDDEADTLTIVTVYQPHPMFWINNRERRNK